jgi:hypothetical protein
VIRALKHLPMKYPHRKTIATEHTYFRENKKRMGYAAQKAEGLMIGSGVPANTLTDEDPHQDLPSLPPRSRNRRRSPARGDGDGSSAPSPASAPGG